MVFILLNYIFFVFEVSNTFWFLGKSKTSFNKVKNYVPINKVKNYVPIKYS